MNMLQRFFKKSTTPTPMQGEVSKLEGPLSELLSRGVEDVFVRADLEKALQSGKRLRIKLGIDPTSKNLHLGRAIPLRKLRDFQRLGHQIVFLVGDFTALIGDPSDKLEKRPMLTLEKVHENMASYVAQAGKILDMRTVEVVYNSAWLSKLNFAEVARLAESFTVQQMLARRNFKERYESGQEISLREFMYPIMQGYDSVAVHADVALGGFDQLFNLKAGRTMQRSYNQPEQNVMTLSMLEGTDGRKMSSSWGNVIAINDAPADMYGKVMSLKDELIVKYFTLTTDVALTEIADIEKALAAGENPKNAKMRLAREVVQLYHGADAAAEAERAFKGVFEEGGVPDDAPSVKVGPEGLASALVAAGIVASKGEYRRLLDEGAIRCVASTGERKVDLAYAPQSGDILKVGKRRFVKIV